MSLSKVYETKDSFTPQDIIPRPDSRGNETEKKHSSFKPDLTADPSGFVSYAVEQMETLPRETELSATGGQSFDASASGDDEILNRNEYPTQSAATEAPPDTIAPETIDRMVDEAYRNGLLEGQRIAEEEFGSAAKTLMHTLQQLENLHETILKNSASEVLDLSLAIAELIIRTSLASQKDTIAATVEETLHLAIKSEEMTVFVNPDDFDTILAKAPELQTSFSGLSRLYVKKDPAVELGGCRLESDNCTVDATIASQLKRIYDHIRQNH